MSDLPPADQPQGTPGRRATRPKSRSSAARRARLRKPVTSDVALDAEERAENEEDAILADTAQDDDEPPTGDFETALSEARDDEASPQKRRLTPLSKQILLWGAIIGIVNVLFGVATTIFYLNFASTQAQANQNSGVVNGVVCLSYIVSFGLPFVAGWRATLREGLGRHGGLAALWSYVFYTVIVLVVELAITAFQGKLSGVSGGDVATFAEDFAIQALISFAFGWFGGSYSSWQRKRNEQRRAREAEAATP